MPVPLELMIMHGRAVMRGAKRALVVVDMPFGSYEESPSQAFRNAAQGDEGDPMRRHQAGRRRGAWPRPSAILTERGIPVMAHIGLTPQSINVLGGFKTQGRTRDRVGGDRGGRQGRRRSRRLLRSCSRRWPSRWPQRSPKASPYRPSASAPRACCDGQILVMEDMLGLSPARAEIRQGIRQGGQGDPNAIRDYAQEVRSRNFPASEHTYAMKDAPPSTTAKGKAKTKA